MPRLSVVLEPPAGTVALRPGMGPLARAAADLPRILTTSRLRVVDALRGLIALALGRPVPPGRPSSSGRVRREEGHWVARPEATAPLSGIVLSMFAVAILSERSFYDRQMCVCDTCGRVSFDATPGMRRACSCTRPAAAASARRSPPRGAARKTGSRRADPASARPGTRAAPAPRGPRVPSR